MQAKSLLFSWIGIVVLCSSSLAASGAESPATSPENRGQLSGKLLFIGSSTMAPMIAQIGKRFSSLYPAVQIEVRSGGSKAAIESVRSGQADIGMVGRSLETSEEDLYPFPVARDGIALIVHRDNVVRNLTKAQAKQVLTGKLSSWKQVGGLARPIVLINGQEGRGSAELLQDYFEVGYSDLKGTVIASNPGRVEAVKGNPGAIAYVSVGYAERMAQAGTPIKVLSIDGTRASTKAVRSGDHTLSRPMILVVKDFPRGLSKAFISFALSSQATETIKSHDFIPYLD